MSPKRKPAPKEEGPKGWLNRAYRYGEAHVATVALVALGLGVVLAAFAFYSFFNERAIERRVTHTETACTLHPAGQKCQTTKQRSDEKRSVASACVLAYKLDKNGRLLRLTKCPVEPRHQKQIEAAEHRGSVSGPVAIVPPEAGDATSAPTGSSQPGRHEGGSGGSTDHPSHPHAPSVPHQSPPVPGEQGGGGEDMPPASPASPPAESSPGPSSSQTTERTTETSVVETQAEAPQPVKQAVGGVVEGVGKTVEGTGEAVDETLHGVTCGLTGALGAPCG